MTSHAKVSDVELSKEIAALPDSIRPLGQCIECTAMVWRDRLQELSARNTQGRTMPVSVKGMVELILKIEALYDRRLCSKVKRGMRICRQCDAELLIGSNGKPVNICKNGHGQ